MSPVWTVAWDAFDVGSPTGRVTVRTAATVEAARAGDAGESSVHPRPVARAARVAGASAGRAPGVVAGSG
ncbi:hypothetical protein, partial [Nocardia cyriacigeorgica]|uniref:hypothetical protein n=1 Tax=Nocardia cyriacigeorgica TaxID=135487 RepID=UPI001CA59D43